MLLVVHFRDRAVPAPLKLTIVPLNKNWVGPFPGPRGPGPIEADGHTIVDDVEFLISGTARSRPH